MPPRSHTPLGTKTTHRHVDKAQAFPKASVPSHTDAFTSLSSPATETQKAFRVAMHWVTAEERRRKVGEITNINVALLGNGISYPQSLGLTEEERSGGSKRSSLGETRGKGRQKVSPGTSRGWQRAERYSGALSSLAQLVSQCQHGLSPGTHGLVGMARFAYF